MSRGVPKDMADKAWEQYEKQGNLVARLENKLEKCQAEEREIAERLEGEYSMLRYYEAHPLVAERLKNIPVEKHPSESYTEPELPLESDLKTTWKGLQGKHVAGD